MARPLKLGLDYYPKDTDVFADRKIRRLLSAHGCKGYVVFEYLLCLCYAGKGYYIDYDNDLAFDVSNYLGDEITEGFVAEVITSAVTTGLFDSVMFEKGILTSQGIQKRYMAAKRNGVIAEETRVITEETGVIAAETPVNVAISVQSKEKKSKEKKSKEKHSLSRATALPVLSDGGSENELRGKYKLLTETLKGKDASQIRSELTNFLKQEQPRFPEPYIDLWNQFALNYKLSPVNTITPGRRRKFAARLGESGFDFLQILTQIGRSGHLRGKNGDWRVSLDWILKNEENYLKIIEGNYNG